MNYEKRRYLYWYRVWRAGAPLRLAWRSFLFRHPPYRSRREPFGSIDDGVTWLRGEVPAGWLNVSGMTIEEMREFLELADEYDLAGGQPD